LQEQPSLQQAPWLPTSCPCQILGLLGSSFRNHMSRTLFLTLLCTESCKVRAF
jgi:hypothetical protein